MLYFVDVAMSKGNTEELETKAAIFMSEIYS